MSKDNSCNRLQTLGSSLGQGQVRVNLRPCNTWSDLLESELQTLYQNALGVDIPKWVIGIDEKHAPDFLALKTYMLVKCVHYILCYLSCREALTCSFHKIL